MNGRVYEPSLGRFLSPDPFVQAPDNTQSFNRYSYVFNNPLSFTDPSGFVADDRPIDETFVFGQRPSPCSAGATCYSGDLSGFADAFNSIVNDFQDYAVENENVVLYIAIEIGDELIAGDAVDAIQSIIEGDIEGAVTKGAAAIVKPLKGAKVIVKALSGKASKKRGNKVQPHPDAEGPHTTWKKDPQTGEITRHETYKPNPRNPSGFDKVQSTDLKGAPHVNKKTGDVIPTPHTQGKNIPGGVRPATPDEIPRYEIPR